MVPPLIKCTGIITPSARASNGIYEFQGTACGRPVYHQTGISSGNHIWFAEEAFPSPMWVITPKAIGVGGCPSQVIAISMSLARWPWEATDWQVCSPLGDGLVPSPSMRLTILNPVAELEVSQTVGLGNDAKLELARYRCAGQINDRPAYKRIDRDDGVEQRLFWLEKDRGPALPRQGRWLLVELNDEGGIDCIVAQSHCDDGCSWASLWPWLAEKGGWERATEKTFGMIEFVNDKQFAHDPAMGIRMLTPGVTFAGCDGAHFGVAGTYSSGGMCNGRCFWIQRMTDAMSDKACSMALWYAEDRGQWVVSAADKLGDSTQVVARIASRAWWPWECHLTSCSSPGLMGAAMLAAMPEWIHGAAMLSQLRTSWELSDAKGVFQQAKEMEVICTTEKQLVITSVESSMHPFLGEYVYAGLLSHRPYYLQVKTGKKVTRYAIWYAEDEERWVITNDYRLMDGTTIDARCDDSAWFPWEVTGSWDVADSMGGFIQDTLLKVAISRTPLATLKANKKEKASAKKKNATSKSSGGSEVSVTPSESEADT